MSEKSRPKDAMTIQMYGTFDEELREKFFSFLAHAQKTFNIDLKVSMYLTDTIQKEFRSNAFQTLEK